MSIHTRTKELVGMVRDAGLQVARTYTKGNRVCVDAVAPNGLAKMFALSQNPGDMRGDLNERALIRRFARQNGVQEQPEEEVKKDEQTPVLLTPAEFYKLCVWVKAAAIEAPNLEALALLAGRHIGQPVSEAVMREAMTATETAEPDHWHPLPEPHIIVANELAAILKQLGVEPSKNFARLMAALNS